MVVVLVVVVEDDELFLLHNERRVDGNEKNQSAAISVRTKRKYIVGANSNIAGVTKRENTTRTKKHHTIHDG